MPKLKHKSQERRKRDYIRLREVGYTSREASKYKDYSAKKIEEFIKLKECFHKKRQEVERGRK